MRNADSTYCRYSFGLVALDRPCAILFKMFCTAICTRIVCTLLRYHTKDT